MAQVDSLNIEISAQATKASASLDKLAGKLNTLSTALSKANGSGLSNFSNATKTLSEGMKNLQGIKAKDFAPIANGIKKFEKLDTGKIASIGGALKPLADGINVLSNAKFENKNLQNLINSLTRFANANISGLVNTDFTALGNSIRTLTSSLAGAEKVQQSTISITNAVANLSKSGANIPIVASSLPQLSIALKGFISSMSGASAVSTETISFTQAIAQLSNAGAKAAVTAGSLGTLATELKKFIQVMSTAPQVSNNIIQMTNALASLARTGSSSGRAADSLSRSVTNLSHTGTKASKTLRGMQNNFRNLLRSILPFAGVFQLISFGKKAAEISSSLTEVQNVVDVTFGKYANLVEKMSETSIVDFGMSELTAKQISSRFQAMGTAMGFAQGQMADMSIELTKLAADMASFYNVEQKDVAEDLAAVFTGQTRPLRTYGIDLTQATLAEWAMKNGLDANIRSMSQAEKTMLRYQYVLASTGAAQGDFARTSGTWANQVRILKQNFEQLASVIGGTLINALKPFVQAMNAAMSYVIAFAQTVSDALGKIFGWKYEVGSGGITNDLEIGEEAAGGIASGMEDAAAAGKKLRDYTLAIDELNIARPGEGTTGGTAGGAGISGAGIGGLPEGSFGQWVKDEERLFESEIDTLYKLGGYVGDALSKALESIKWSAVYEKAKNFGKGLANFLNGLISPRLFGNVGKTIAGSLNSALYFLNSFGRTFNWKNFGDSIAEGINNFFRTFDFKNLAETINVWIKGALTSATVLLRKTDFEQIGEKIGQFLKELDFSEIAGDLADAIWEAIKAGFDLLKGLIKEAPLETALIAAFSTFKFLKSSSFVASLFSKSVANQIGKSTISVPSLRIMVGTVIIGYELAKNTDDAAEFAIGKLNEEIRKSSVSGIESGLSQTVWAEQISGIREYRKNIEGMGAAVSAMFGALSQKLSEVAPEISDRFENIKESAVNAMREAARSVSEKASEIYEDIVQIAPEVGGAIDELESLFGEGKVARIVGGMSKPFGELPGKVQDALNGIAQAITGSPIEQSATRLKDNIAEISGGIPKAIGETKKQTEEELEALNQSIAESVSLSEKVFDEEASKNGKLIGEGFRAAISQTTQYINEELSSERSFSTGSNYVQGLKLGIESEQEPVNASILTLAQGINKRFLEILGIHSPSTITADAAKNYLLGFENTIVAGIKTGENAIRKWGEAVNAAVKAQMDNMLSIVLRTVNSIVASVSSISSAIEKARSDMEAFKNFANGFSLAAGIKANVTGGITISGISRYATGGFPEDGWFRASKGEYFGQFDDGTSYIANNNQIEYGIAAGVEEAAYRGMMRALQESGNASLLADIAENTRISADKDFSVSIDGRELVSAYDERKIRNGYAFT